MPVFGSMRWMMGLAALTVAALGAIVAFGALDEAVWALVTWVIFYLALSIVGVVRHHRRHSRP